MSDDEQAGFDASWVVPEEHAGIALKDFLTDVLVDLASSEIQRLLRQGYVKVGDRGGQGGLRLAGGDRVFLAWPDDRLHRLEPRPLKGFEALYEDESVLAAFKPAGVGVTADRGQKFSAFLGACLHHFRGREPERSTRPRVVHRLDKETSGVVLIAKSREALRSLTSQFEAGAVGKDYLALVLGEPHREEGVIDLPIGMEVHTQKLRAGGKNARPAETRFSVEERFRGYALLRLRPITGRQHQIRLHCEAVGHPLVVDPLYGGQEALLLSSFKRRYNQNRKREERPLLSRLSLHAARIVFRSPARDEEVVVDAPFPKDMRVALKQLRKWAPPRG